MVDMVCRLNLVNGRHGERVQKITDENGRRDMVRPATDWHLASAAVFRTLCALCSIVV